MKKNTTQTITQKLLKLTFMLFTLLLLSGQGWAQTSTQNFGTGTAIQTSSTGSTAIIPNPTSGTTWARGGATVPNAPINIANTSNPIGTTGSYVRAVASTSTSVSKFSPWVGYTGGTEFYTTFKVLFGDASAGSTAASGNWSFYQGAGVMYSDASDFAGAQVFTGLRFTYGAGGALALTYRGGSAWINTGLTTSSFNSATVYTIEIVGNNKTSGTISYNYYGTAKTVAVQKFDLYVNGTLIGDDLAEALLPANTSITSGTFIGISSTLNVANIFVDDAIVYNSVPASIGSSSFPTVTTPTATSITDITAVLGGNITSDGGSAITERGSVWKTSTGVLISDNLLAEGGTATGTFSHSRSSLPAGTQLFYKAYATNGIGTTLTSESSFWTLSTEPSAYSTTFTNNVISQTQIDLSFDALSTLSNATGYLILKKAGSAITGTPTDGNAYALGVTIVDATVGAVVTNTSVTSVSMTGLTAGTTYYFTLIPFNNGANNATYNYKTDITIPNTSATTQAPLDATSYVSGPALGSQPAPALSSLFTTDAAAVRVFDMNLYDDASSDAQPTKITQITIKAGTNNTANWTNTLQAVKLSLDGGVSFATIGTPTITASTIVIPVTSGNLDIANNSSATLSLYIYLKSSALIDNKILEFKVDGASHGFTADATGSTFTASFASVPVSNPITIDVAATKFNFSTQPSNTTVNTNFTAAVEATDANGNRDLNSTATVTLTVSAGTLSSATGLVLPLLNGLLSWTDLQNNTAGTGITLSATGSLTTAVSNPFNVLNAVYSHDFGTATITTKPYTAAPVIFAANLSNSSWTTSAAAFGSLTGSSGSALSITNSSGTPTFTLTFDIAAGYQLAVNSFDFWRVRSSSGAQNWAMTINGISVGSGTIPTTGAAIGQTPVSNTISGLTGTVTVIYTMSGASGTGTCRLDDFNLYGDVTLAPQPEMDVQANGLSIADGSVTPSVTDWTDFGSVLANSGSFDRSFTIFNTGTASLTLTATPKVAISGAAAADFSITTLPSSPVATGGNTTFVVHFAPTAVGTRSATLSIANDDINENPYDFVIQGTGYTPPCEGTPAGGTASATITSAVCSTGSDLSLSGQSNETGITLQWQYYDGSNWQDISGATTNPYTVSGITATTQYRCNVTCTNSSITVASATVTVTVNAATGGTTTATVNPLCSGSSSVLSLTGATAAGVTYSWESSTDGVNYSAIGGAASSTYTASPTVDTYYKCKLSCSASDQNSYSTALQLTMNITATNVSSPSASVDFQQSQLSWTKQGCLNEILIVASSGSPNTATVAGDGSAYAADAVFGNGTAIGNGYVVYKGSASTQLLTGLNNGTIYYYKFFSRNGTNWSSGIEVSATPSIISATAIVFAGAAGCTTGGSGLWLTNTNWCGAVIPSSATVAQFGAIGTNTTISFNMNGATAAQKSIGAIELSNTNTIARTIINSSPTVDGSITLNGVIVNTISNVIIRNNSSNLLSINTGANVLGIDLNNVANNIINIDGSGGVSISAAITGSGKNLTIAGVGTGELTLSGANTYTGLTTVNASTLKLNRTGGTTIPVTNDVIINGGTLQVSTDQTLNNLDLSSGNLTIDNGVTLTVNGTFTIAAGSISGTGVFVYGTNGALKYSGSISQTATNLEFPSSSGPKDLIIDNTAGLSFGLSRTISGNLTINTAKNLTLNSVAQLSVNGALTNNAGAAGLILRSDATGTASLIHSTSSVNATIERYITQYTVATDGWRFISSPVNNAVVGNFTPTVNDDLFRYNETDNEWKNWQISNFDFTDGIGYLSAYAAGGTRTFTGTVNTTAVAFSNLTKTAGQGEGWQLLGNPFASPLKWNDGNWNLNNIDGLAKVLNSGGGYTDLTANDIIPGMQGFLVQVTAAPGSLTISPASRTHSNTNILNKASNNDRLLLKAASIGNNTYTESVITINDNASNGFDKDYDSHFLAGMYGTPSFYSLMGNDKLSTNSIPSFNGSMVIPMGFTAGVANNYSITAEGVTSFTNFSSIILEDTKTNTFQNLMQNQIYNFTSAVTDNTMRFRLHFNAALTVGEINGNIAAIYAFDNTVYVNAKENIQQIAVYNTLGQLVKTIYPHTAFTSFSLSGMPTNYYIVKLITDKSVYTEKIFVK